jgi:hypothetical protein
VYAAGYAQFVRDRESRLRKRLIEFRVSGFEFRVSSFERDLRHRSAD